MATISGPSLGYAGSITEITGMDFFNRIGAAKYGVVGTGDLAVTTTTGDRMLLIASGVAWGHNIQDTLGTSVSVQLDSVASGSRWDMIVVRRDVAVGTTIEVVKGSSDKVLPSLTSTAASHPDQPIALCRVAAGSTTVAEIIDLRCWASNGGVVVVDRLALDYLATPGAEVSHGDAVYKYVPDSQGAFAWRKQVVVTGSYSVSTTTATPNRPNTINFAADTFTSKPNVQVTWESGSGQPPRLRTFTVTTSSFGVNVMSDVGVVSGIVHWRASQE